MLGRSTKASLGTTMKIKNKVHRNLAISAKILKGDVWQTSVF
jgi:hypothetical protein